MATKFWRWLGHENNPAIAVVPVYDEHNDNGDPWTRNPHCIEYEMVGRVTTIGSQVVAEWLYTRNRRSKSHYIFEFESPARAQAFAKRIKERKHLVLVAGEDCIRVVMVSSNPQRNKIRTAADVDGSIRNAVSHLGKAMTKSETRHYEFLEATSYEKLVKKLTEYYRRSDELDVPHIMGVIDNSDMFEEENAEQA
jgi:hypothetical protein